MTSSPEDAHRPPFRQVVLESQSKREMLNSEVGIAGVWAFAGLMLRMREDRVVMRMYRRIVLLVRRAMSRGVDVEYTRGQARESDIVVVSNVSRRPGGRRAVFVRWIVSLLG